ncbi:hypothetical protein, partial [Mycobacterium heckeshornense]|uniref:hypothetical protein n=1 Tax=Mycobacterium heckeshornense TaxID=110505 RepID=UPI001F161531
PAQRLATTPILQKWPKSGQDADGHEYVANVSAVRRQSINHGEHGCKHKNCPKIARNAHTSVRE